MQHPLWDDEMKFELFRFRSELKTEHIRVLAEPLGLGLVKRESSQGRSLYPQLAHAPMQPETAAAKNLKAKATPAAVPMNYPTPSEMPAASLQASPVPPISNPDQALMPRADRPQQSAPRRWLFLLLSHCVDLGFVGLCLGLGFIVLGFVIDPANMSLHPKILLEAAPAQVLRQVHGLALMVGVYVVFGCYWFFFRIVSGATLGETCLHNFSHDSEPPRSASVKASGDS
jgi:hypothetical protein